VIGIVIVSHSYGLAEGVAELAAEMGGADVAIETAGGLEGEEHPMGTDAIRVMEAVERAWSDDGVLVLMDLGSAVLSAEMALDLLPEERRTSVLLCEAPLVEGAVAAAVAARLGRSLEDVAAEARGGLSGKAAHLGVEPEPAAPVQPPPGPAGPVRSIVVTVDLPHGLHARPAARLVQAAGAFDAEVTVANRTTGRGPVTARSLNAVATLGVVRGQELEVAARGPQADAALDAIRDLAARSFDEREQAREPAPDAAPAGQGSSPDVPGSLRGLPASPGIALGPARHLRTIELDVPDRPPATPREERAALEAALAAARDDVERQRAAALAAIGAEEAAIFEAHRLFLEDPAILDPARERIAAGASASVAWRESVDAVAVSWGAVEDPYLGERVEDLRSVAERVRARLLGIEVPPPTIAGRGILVARDLTPADATALDPSAVIGILTAGGAPTSHAAVLARALGIPAVVGAGVAALGIAEGTELALDGGAGLVRLEPDEALVEELTRARAERDRLLAAARRDAGERARTEDGVEVEVAANVGTPAEVPGAVEAGADGIGLFRTEFLFLGSGVPAEQEQEAAYRRAAEALGGRPMIVRTLDAGADKPVPGVPTPDERNPFLGVRGIRMGLAVPELLEPQLRALLRVAADHPVRVLFPMVSTLGELRRARAALDRARRSLGTEAPLEVGVMVEVPSAAIIADAFAPEVDFFSIGTNDLTQYALAAERGNERVAALADPLDPAVLRLIRMTVDAARAAGIWVGVCGELAGDPDATALLVGLGVRELSMAAPSIPLVKNAVRSTSTERATALADLALRQPSAASVREVLAGRG